MTYHSYQLERRKDQDFFCAVSCFEAHMEACTGPSDRFVLGEPVHTSEPFLGAKHNKDRVFWLARITDREDHPMDPQVHLTFTRHGGHGDTSVCPTQLRKLPAMLRIAHEADLA